MKDRISRPVLPLVHDEEIQDEKIQAGKQCGKVRRDTFDGFKVKLQIGNTTIFSDTILALWGANPKTILVIHQ